VLNSQEVFRGKFDEFYERNNHGAKCVLLTSVQYKYLRFYGTFNVWDKDLSRVTAFNVKFYHSFRVKLKQAFLNNYTHTHTHTNTQHKNTHKNTHTYKHTNTHIHTHTNTHKNTHIHKHTHTHKHTQKHTQTHTYTHTQTYAHTHKLKTSACALTFEHCVFLNKAVITCKVQNFS